MRPDLAVEKLLKLEVRPALISVVKSFLTERQQRVKYCKHISSYQQNSVGVPQGTIMVLFYGTVLSMTSAQALRESNTLTTPHCTMLYVNLMW